MRSIVLINTHQPNETELQMGGANSRNFKVAVRNAGLNSSCWMLIFLVISCIGCSGDSRVAVVRGTVTLDGEPVPEASLTFMPKDGGRPAFGITDANGAFTLTTFGENDGAIPGMHSVTITAVEENVSDKTEELAEEYGSLSEVMQPRRRPKQTWRVPERYSESKTSELSFEVKRGEKNVASFSLSTKP